MIGPGKEINHNLLEDVQIAAENITYGHIDDQSQSIDGEKTFSDKFKVKLNDSGVTPNPFSVFLIENNNHTYFQLLVPDGKLVGFKFSNETYNTAVGFLYNGVAEIFGFTVHNVQVMSMSVSEINALKALKASGGLKSADGSEGVTGSFTDNDGNTITVKNGIITGLS